MKLTQITVVLATCILVTKARPVHQQKQGMELLRTILQALSSELNSLHVYELAACIFYCECHLINMLVPRKDAVLILMALAYVGPAQNLQKFNPKKK